MAEGEEDIVTSLSKLGIRAPMPFDAKKDNIFDYWLKSLEYHFTLAKLEENKTAALLCQLDLEANEIAEKAGINNTTSFKDACDHLKEHYAVTETVEELREKFAQRAQLQNENLNTYA